MSVSCSICLLLLIKVANCFLVLLFVLWYCYKRGREVRLEREQTENTIDGGDRIEELPDDPTLPAPPPRTEVTTADEPLDSVRTN